MSYKWDYNDHKIWSSNEVLKQLEMTLMKRAVELKDKLEAQMVGGKIKETKKDIADLDKSLTVVTQKVKNLADDDSGEPAEPTEEEYAEAKANLISELKEKAVEAADHGNKKLAYQIERTIDELMFEE
jgi:diphthamide synthase (EF-2-diphthine--ammonia ligase)